MRWLAVVLFVPLLSLGILRGASFLAHPHHEDGVHVHAIMSEDASALSSIRCGSHEHEHDRPTPRDLPDPIELGQAPAGVVVSLPDQQPMPTRSIDLGKALVQVGWVAPLGLIGAECGPDPGRPAAAPTRGLLNLLHLSAVERLVLTSRALVL